MQTKMFSRLFKILQFFFFGGKRFPPELERNYRIASDDELQQRLRAPALSVAVLVSIFVLSQVPWRMARLSEPTIGLMVLSAIYVKLVYFHRPKRLFQMIMAVGTILYAWCIALIIWRIPGRSIGAVYAFAYLIAISNFLAPRLRVPQALLGAGGAAVILFLACIMHPAHLLYSQNTALLLMNMISAIVFGVFVVFRYQVEGRVRYKSDEVEKIQRRRADGIAESARMIAHDLRKGLFNLGKGADPILKNIAGTLEPILFDMLLLGKTRNPLKQSAKMSDVVEEVVKDLLNRYPKSKVDAIKVPDFGDLHIRMAPDLLHRLLENLLDNAYQAIDQSALPSGRIWILKKDQDNRFIRVIFGNTFDPKTLPDLNRILEPHYSHGKAKGTGLGLAIVQKIVVEAGGWITVRISGSDTIEFVLSLPIGKFTQPVPQIRAKAKSFLYVVEDNPFVVEDWRSHCPSNLSVFSSPELFAEQIRSESFEPETQYIFVVDNHFDDEPDWSARRLVDLIEEISPSSAVFISSFVPTSIPLPHLAEKRGYTLAELQALAASS